jgi:hypothetical protein
MIAMVFVSSAPKRGAMRALGEAAGDAIEAMDPGEDLPEGFDEPSVGAFEVSSSPEGAVLQIEEGPDDLEGLMARVCARLARRGLSGTFEPFVPSRTVREPPPFCRLVETWMRVVGERYDIKNLGIRMEWAPRREALAAVMAAGISWCREIDDGSGLSLVVGLTPRVPVTDDEVTQQVVDAFGVRLPIEVSCVTDDRFRIASTQSDVGIVSLIEGGGQIEHGGWRDPVGRMREFLIENARSLIYGVIKHGTHVQEAILGESLAGDWPARDGLTRGPTSGYEDAYALDAFAIQLLGPGYTGRVPAGESWRATTVPPAHALLEHADPAAWFQDLFTRRGGTLGAQEPGIPPVLAAARRDFAPILFDHSIARSRPPKT